MDEFAAFLAQHRFMWPAVMAVVSVYAQLAIGALLIIGWQTRWAGAICALHFVVACVMVHSDDSFRGLWPAAVLVTTGLLFAAHGAGRFSIDRS
jgi:putative oxidoreductase